MDNGKIDLYINIGWGKRKLFFHSEIDVLKHNSFSPFLSFEVFKKRITKLRKNTIKGVTSHKS